MTPCVIAPGVALDGGGYRVMWDKLTKRVSKAHIIAARDHLGPRPKGMVVRHKCDNRECWEPTHLEYGTTSQNNNEDRKRNNKVYWKLTQELADQIRIAEGTTTAIGERFGVSNVMVSKIKRGVAWA